MITITINFEIPPVGISFHPNYRYEFNASNYSVTISLPFIDQEVWNPLLQSNDKLTTTEVPAEEDTPTTLPLLLTYDDPHPSFTYSLVRSKSGLFNEDEELLLLPTTTIDTTEPAEPAEPELVTLARKCLANDDSIQLCPDGVGGTYFIKDESGKIIAVFKPTDEEPGAVNNPKKLLEDPLLPPGGGTKREIAAYMLDKSRAGVPETYFLKDVQNNAFNNSNGEHTKSGSIQRFVENIGDTTSIGSSLFSVDDVHNIGILDTRILNMDRNDENMLVRKDGNKHKLVPIDHAFTFPHKLDSVWFDWMYWRQAKQPFSQETLDYIKSIDIDEDAEMLKSLELEDQSILNMRISTTLLKKGAASGLTLFAIASILCRKKLTEKSEMEIIVERTTKGEAFDMEEFEKLVDELVQSKL